MGTLWHSAHIHQKIFFKCKKYSKGLKKSLSIILTLLKYAQEGMIDV